MSEILIERDRKTGTTKEGVYRVHACPVCNGQLTVNKPPFIAGDQETWPSGTTCLYQCPTCKGTGVIWEKVGGVKET